MNYKRIWKITLIIVIVISAILVAPSVLKIYELSDNVIRILGTADVVALFVLAFSFVKNYMKQ